MKEDIFSILEKCIPLKDRIPKLSSIGPWNDEETYSKFINEWIPNQPDSENLMKLMILSKFHLKLFICLLSKRDDMVEKYLREIINDRA